MAEIGAGEYVDVWVNLPFRERRVLDPTIERWFAKSSPEMYGGVTPEMMVQRMDEAGIEKGLLTCLISTSTEPAGRKNPHSGGFENLTLDRFAELCESVASVCRAYPGRLYGAALLDPTQGMNAVRMLEMSVRDFDFRAARLFGASTNTAPNDPLCYPLYTKAIELGIPITVNVGVPGPMRFARFQRPMDLDEVLIALPEVKIVMTHIGHPWHLETLALLQKHPNAYLMTSGWAPKHIPEEIVRYLNTRGREKVMWSADYPALTFERCISEAHALPLRDGVLRRYMRENALEVFDFA
jgi:predicted TIM-barrel fold metal-dependent hydrolase